MTWLVLQETESLGLIYPLRVLYCPYFPFTIFEWLKPLSFATFQVPNIEIVIVRLFQ